MKTKDILITLRSEKNKHNCHIEVLESAYVAFFEQFGVRIIPLPNSASQLDKYLDSNLNLQGVILSGGNSINPSLYGNNDLKLQDVSDRRDKCEIRILEKAIEMRIPVLGICRGLQLINVFFGGVLVNNEKEETYYPPALDHPVFINNS